MSVCIVILAAGKGTRMKSDLAKVLHVAAGHTLLDWALEAVALLDVAETVVVVGHQSDAVSALVGDRAHAVEQAPQLGTADAVRVGLAGLSDRSGTVLVLPGDMPLLSSAALQRLLDAHAATHAAATVLTARAKDPGGYGRVLRDGDQVVGIVEDGDADETQLAIDEINTSVYAFDGPLLESALAEVTDDNSQTEFYLTDVVEILAARGHSVGAAGVDELEAAGVNSHGQLAAVAAVLRGKINEAWMSAGVWMLDPSRVYLDATVQLAPGVKLYPDVYLEGGTTVDEGAEIGPSVQMRDSTVGAGASVRYAVVQEAQIGDDVSVGPFTYLRPGAELAPAAKAGSFVEIKNSQIGPGSKVPHLSYVGDATIGEGSNLGAGTVTVNYDGFKKHRTTIGDRVRIGSDTMLVAPVTIGDDAYTGAGSVISQDVPPGSLAIERSDQKEVPGYAERRRRRLEEPT
jgi:bifunctional UDP-N-acetylglucosamine pyrophosphorylase/glucosamine-1-phosphate N-acetyltransferase